MVVKMVVVLAESMVGQWAFSMDIQKAEKLVACLVVELVDCLVVEMVRKKVERKVDLLDV